MLTVVMASVQGDWLRAVVAFDGVSVSRWCVVNVAVASHMLHSKAWRQYKWVVDRFDEHSLSRERGHTTCAFVGVEKR